MQSIITYENLRDFCYCNDALICGGIRGVIVQFMGLGNMEMHAEDPERGRALAEKGIALLIPYNNPWNWMNAQAVAFTDALLDALWARHQLADGLPVVCVGGSMGGLCALVYTRYAKRVPAACVVNCPVCDLPYHYTERPDLPRTLYSAFAASGAATLDEALRAHSPLHLAAELPDIPYVIFHCEADTLVNIHRHSDRFVEALRGRRQVAYIRVPGRDHCDLGEAAQAEYERRAEAAILR